MAAGTQLWDRMAGGAAAAAMAPLPAADRSRGGSQVLDVDSESELVARCLNGDESAWEDLVRTYTRRVYSICYRFTGRESEAQDLTQEVFLKVFRNVRSFRAGEGSFGVWLARLTRNLLIDHYRRSRMERATASIEEQLPMLEERAAIEGRTEAVLAGREASEALQKALARLSPELRETVILRDIEGMEYREIAQVLGVPEGTVKSRLNRGRSELARALRQMKVVP
ncbi:MAG: sigma-70 family RNA polymerase sigma factor [Bryobacteraceae bacterium]|nr:sigma-70 family RNA polymerase sigma factor [Bryobacteraceae bacterium]MCX7603126.1 sigma-70 family RNA polymerase sigma factor [Bryobacteraceae bacterium]